MRNVTWLVWSLLALGFFTELPLPLAAQSIFSDSPPAAQADQAEAPWRLPPVEHREQPSIQRDGLRMLQVPPEPPPLPSISREATPPAMAPQVAEPRMAGVPLEVEVTTQAQPPQAEVPTAEVVAAPEEAPANGSGVTREMLELRLKAIQADETIDEAIKAELIKHFTIAVERVKVAEEAAQKTNAYETEIAGAPELTKHLRERLATPVVELAPPHGSGHPLAKIEQQLAEYEAELKIAKEEVAKAEDERKRRGERTTELAKQISEMGPKLEEFQKQLAAVPAGGENDLLREARQLEVEARNLALERQRTLFRTEQKRLEALSETFPLIRDLANRKAVQREKEVNNLQQVVAQRRQLESERLAWEARRKVENTHPALKDLAERNADLAELRSEMTVTLDERQSETKAISTLRSDLDREFDSLQEKVKLSRHTTTIGLLLRKHREQLPPWSEHESRVRRIEQDIPKIDLRLIELEAERATLGDIDAEAGEIIDGLNGSIQQFEPEYVRGLVVDLLTRRRDTLDRLIHDHEAYLNELTELEIETERLMGSHVKISSFIDEQVLWIRSDDALNWGTITTAGKGFVTMFYPARWLELGKQLGLESLRNPVVSLSFVVLGLLIFAFNRRLSQRLEDDCQKGNQRGFLSLYPTLEGLGVAAVIAAQWPIFLLYVGWRLSLAYGSTEFGGSVASALILVSLVLWSTHFAIRLTNSDGLGATHFGWGTKAFRGLRTHLSWFILSTLPLAFITVFCRTYQDGVWGESLGRVAFMGAMLLTALFCHLAFHPKGHLFNELAIHPEHTWLYRLRYLLYVLAVGAPLLLAGMAGAGFYYSASQLAVRFKWTLIACGTVLLFYGIVSRWILVKRRNLALRLAKQRMQAAQEAAKSEETIQVVEEQPDLTTIQKELHNLLHYAVLGTMMVAGWMVWSDVMPALRIFDRVPLWTTEIAGSGFIKGEDGQFILDAEGQPISTTKEVATTWWHAILATLIVVVTFLVGRKLPSLLEITVLERLPIDRGGKHAISVITLYVITMGGVLTACGTLNITWSSVQWLAAAMTVGLGFGMQEIFANFISGIIILFERPVRVGDLVTVGGVTGRVTRMQIRATTITDFDRRELLVPNKKFITDDVMNWTLSDHVNRLLIEIGVAHGSDTELAKQLLTEAAMEHPQILEDPAPVVTFDKFGDSALNLTMRCYLPNMDCRLQAIHEIHTAIDKKFRAAKISIAFPQQDIHVYGLESLMPNSEKMSSRRSQSEAA